MVSLPRSSAFRKTVFIYGCYGSDAARAANPVILAGSARCSGKKKLYPITYEPSILFCCRVGVVCGRMQRARQATQRAASGGGHTVEASHAGVDFSGDDGGGEGIQCAGGWEVGDWSDFQGCDERGSNCVWNAGFGDGP